ncbi:hypothetical protein [Xanthomonas phage RTH11]|nr:hypothetical protein [Xanthomonas phage RTH11]
MKIRALYKAILEAAGAIIDDDGLISMTRPGDEPVPFMVDDKRLAMPTEALLNKGAFNPDGALIAFHPICENVVLDTGPVLSKFETAMTYRLTHVLRQLIIQLTSIAADPKQHKKLKMRAHGLLSALPEADEKTRDAFIKAMENTTITGAKKLITLYVRKGGSYGGEKVSRHARFYPHVVDLLDEAKRTLVGVTLRKADVPAFLTLIEYILPEYRDPDRYSSPSNSQVAPTFHALVKTYHKVASQLNKIVNIHADHLQDAESLLINTEWFEDVQDLSKYRELIPVLPGNDGVGGTKAVKAPAAAPVVGQPAAKAAASGAASGRSVDDFLRNMMPARPVMNAGGWGGGARATGWAAASNPDNDLPPWARTQAAGFTPNNGGNRGFGSRSPGGTGAL